MYLNYVIFFSKNTNKIAGPKYVITTFECYVITIFFLYGLLLPIVFNMIASIKLNNVRLIT